jgi:hypothetical protein
MGSFTASTIAHDAKRAAGDLLAIRMGITKIFKGDIVVLKTDGYCYSAYATGATGDQFVGVAAETLDNRYLTEGDSGSGAASAGDRQIRCWQEGVFEFDCASATIQTDLGLTAWASEGSGTDTPRMILRAAPAHPCIVGVIVELIGTQTAATKCRVRISAWSAVAS